MIHNKQMPHHMAALRRIAVTNMTLGLLWSEAFWKTWAAVMWPGETK